MADASSMGDGTYDPAPLPLWPDPLAGLVTGADYQQLDWFQPASEMSFAEPVTVDQAAVRARVDAMLADEEAMPVKRKVVKRQLATPPTRQPPGLLPANSRAAWPGSAAVRSRLPSRAARQQLQQTRGLPGFRQAPPLATRQRPPQMRRQNSFRATGLIVALIVLAVVIFLYVIQGIVASLSSLFN